MIRALSLASALVGLAACGGSDKRAEGPSQGGGGDDGVTIGDRNPDTREPIHVADDDGDDDDSLSVSGLRGRLDSYDIERGVQPHAQALSACYYGNVGRQRYIGGDIELKFLIARSGEVKQVQLSRSDLGAWSIERCLLETARRMIFVKPKGGEAVFSLPLEFSPTRSSRWLEEDVGLQQVKPFVKELRDCAKEASTRNPRGVTITVYVGPRGVVKSVGFASDAKREITAEWADCADAKIRAWTLGDPLGRIAKLAFRYN
jgi:hypothetical protein